LWGIAQVTFGLSFPLVGMAMSFAVVVGLGVVVGSFVPMAVFYPGQLFGTRGLTLLVSTLILAVGLRLYTKAARQREADSNPAGAQESRAKYRLGLFLCIFTGTLGSALNLGFALSNTLTERLKSSGATPLDASFAIWAVVLTGGSIPNLAYSIYLLVKNRTGRHFAESAGRESALAVAMGVLWLGGTMGYGVGATVMGSYGTSIGYAIYVMNLILGSTVLGVMTGEWKLARAGTYRLMKVALGVILVSVLLLSATGLF
jgi:L-rhamnose-H+ transport protein